MLDSFEDVVDVVMHCSHSIEPFFCGRGEEFVVIVGVYSTCIKPLETSALGDFVVRSGCGIVGKFCER